MDNLRYTPIPGTNKISYISDAAMNTQGGFRAVSGSFTYDASGNQVSYGAKGISSITYNHLNLPTKYTWSGSNLEVQYDASGNKLKKIPSTGNSKTYIGNIEYSGTSIEAIYHSEGRARLISSTWEYEYAIKDHLGNARVYFKYNGSITFLQESHYYPFGMEQGGWSAPVSPENKYKYNGKEYNDDFSLGLYDYGARWYDPVVGRWGQVDPMSEKFLSFTPFNYTNNNPINFIDPDGNSTGPPRTPDDSKNDANGAAMYLSKPKGDFFDRSGNYLGNDGIKDGKVYLLNEGFRARTEDNSINWGAKLNTKHASQVKSASTEVGGLIILKRVEDGEDYTLSNFTTKGGNSYVEGDILEPSGPSTSESNKDKRIPEGVYNLNKYSSADFPNNFILSNNEVLKSRKILFHSGNTGLNTSGCLLPGCRSGDGNVSNSKAKMNELRNYINNIGTDRVKLIIK